MKHIFALFALILLCSGIYPPDKNQIKVFNDKKKSRITYAMQHPLHSWTAESGDVTSVILCDEDKKQISQVAVSAPIASFDSQNANRDSHAIEVTEALKYPNITFESNDIQAQGDSLEVKGTLTFHGVKQPISFKASQKENHKLLEVSGSFRVTMTAFNIDPPSLMGIATEDHIDISFDIFY